MPGSYVVKDKPTRDNLIPRGATSLIEFSSGCWHCPGSTLLAHRVFFEQVGTYDENLRRFEDYELFLRVGQKGGELDVCPHILATINSSPTTDRHPPDESLKRIEATHAVWMQENNPNAYKRMQAYFELERAASHFRQGRKIKGAAAMARSLTHHPRLSTHVIDRWQKRQPYLDAQVTNPETS